MITQRCSHQNQNCGKKFKTINLIFSTTKDCKNRDGRSSSRLRELRDNPNSHNVIQPYFNFCSDKL